MRIPGTDRLRRATRRIKTALAPPGLILTYHRVADVDLDPWGLCVSPRRFAEHLDVLQKHHTPLPLQRLLRSLEDGRIPRRAVVLTFDDGYADNLYQARPLLERYDVPATFFLTTGYLERRREFWWDELERLLLQSDPLPETLRLTLGERRHEWNLKDAARPGERAARQRRSWRAWEEAPSARHALYYTLWQHLYELPGGAKQKALDDLRAWADAPAAARRTHRPLRAEEAKTLAQGDRIEIGAHTTSHPALALLPASMQREEIQQSKAYLEQLLGRPVTSFSYPHGHYTAETGSIVRRAGFACACSTTAAPVRPSADRFQLPRLQVMNWSGDEFAQRLSAWRAADDESWLLDIFP